MMASTQHYESHHDGDYSDPFSFPNPHNGGSDDLNNDFLHDNERAKSDLLRSKSQNEGRYGDPSVSQRLLEPEDHEYYDGPSQSEGSQATTLADSASGLGRPGKYQDLG
jgi:hypothetical protein